MKATLAVFIVSWILYVTFAIVTEATAPAPTESGEDFLERAVNSSAWAGLATLAFVAGIVSTVVLVVKVIMHKSKGTSQSSPRH
jgi:hypothetical protein